NSEFTYFNTFEENGEEDIFDIDQVSFASARALLNDDDDDVDWTEIEVEDSDLYESFLTMHDVEDTIIERTPTQNQKLTPCVVIDTNQGEIKCCDSTTSLRRLEQMIGTWEIDANAVEDAKDSDHRLGVCYSHFILDQNKLYDQGMKQSHSIEQSIIHIHLCLFCNKKKCFFSRGDCCETHSWNINGCNIQVPCVSAFDCFTFIEGSIAQKLFTSFYARYICSECFQQEDGHFYERLGKGQKTVSCTEREKHCDDTSDALRDIRKWLISVA
ncbi:9877_t:CDS:1, partial [Ambispora gerdemannii]